MRNKANVGTSRTIARSTGKWFTGLSRQGVVAAERFTNKPRTRTTVRQFMSLLTGTMLIGLGVSMFVQSRLGVPAYDVMLSALRDILGVTHGQAGWLFTGALFVVAAVLGHRPRIDGLVYLLATGVAVDVWLSLINVPDPLILRMLFVVIGTASIAAGVALVVHAGLTGGSLELLMHAAEDHNIDPFRFRMLFEVGVVALGVILGGDLGWATVFFVLAMTPMLKAGRQALEDHRRGRAERLRPCWD